MRRAALIALFLAGPAAAFDPFEIQIYDGTADAPGESGLELHLNRAPGVTHWTFEPSIGLTRFWELGAYLQFAQGRYEGVKLRSKFVAPQGTFPHLRLGVNFELAREPDAWGGEIRPIVAWEDGRFLFAANPIVSFPAAFEPGAMAKIKLGPVALGVEYYSSLPHEHYLFEAVDLLSVKNLELNAAVGQGLTGESASLIFKMIIGYTFGGL
jgi:hypothetical protein